MSYVAYHVETTLLLNRKTYATPAAAKAAITRHLKCTTHGDQQAYSIADSVEFHNSIEQQVPRINAMSGETYYERINTPSFCSPASDAYWSA